MRIRPNKYFDWRNREVNLQKGWKCMKESPPKEEEHIVRRTLCDMQAHYYSNKPMEWRLVRGGFQKGGSLKHIWKPINKYLSDVEERCNRGGDHYQKRIK